jgi:hypothetical protein
MSRRHYGYAVQPRPYRTANRAERTAQLVDAVLTKVPIILFEIIMLC